eukprot:augustus_masked-scaffold_5-processed-gene-4.48-mRNA-1 protein AED:1.00 eAED:1.00 QI:0/-1/0/0/-1/1/1/0/631
MKDLMRGTEALNSPETSSSDLAFSNSSDDSVNSPEKDVTCSNEFSQSINRSTNGQTQDPLLEQGQVNPSDSKHEVADQGNMNNSSGLNIFEDKDSGFEIENQIEAVINTTQKNEKPLIKSNSDKGIVKRPSSAARQRTSSGRQSQSNETVDLESLRKKISNFRVTTKDEGGQNLGNTTVDHPVCLLLESARSKASKYTCFSSEDEKANEEIRLPKRLEQENAEEMEVSSAAVEANQVETPLIGTKDQSPAQERKLEPYIRKAKKLNDRERVSFSPLGLRKVVKPRKRLRKKRMRSPPRAVHIRHLLEEKEAHDKISYIQLLSRNAALQSQNLRLRRQLGECQQVPRPPVKKKQEQTRPRSAKLTSKLLLKKQKKKFEELERNWITRINVSDEPTIKSTPNKVEKSHRTKLGKAKKVCNLYSEGLRKSSRNEKFRKRPKSAVPNYKKQTVDVFMENKDGDPIDWATTDLFINSGFHLQRQDEINKQVDELCKYFHNNQKSEFISGEVVSKTLNILEYLQKLLARETLHHFPTTSEVSWKHFGTVLSATVNLNMEKVSLLTVFDLIKRREAFLVTEQTESALTKEEYRETTVRIKELLETLQLLRGYIKGPLYINGVDYGCKMELDKYRYQTE